MNIFLKPNDGLFSHCLLIIIYYGHLQLDGKIAIWIAGLMVRAYQIQIILLSLVSPKKH